MFIVRYSCYLVINLFFHTLDPIFNKYISFISFSHLAIILRKREIVLKIYNLTTLLFPQVWEFIGSFTTSTSHASLFILFYGWHKYHSRYGIFYPLALRVLADQKIAINRETIIPQTHPYIINKNTIKIQSLNKIRIQDSPSNIRMNMITPKYKTHKTNYQNRLKKSICKQKRSRQNIGSAHAIAHER